MLTEDFCSYEVAKLLKEKGFDEPLKRFYNSEGKKGISSYYNWNLTDCDCSCPTHQMAMKWLREVHNIIFVFKPASFSGEKCTFWTYELWCGDNFEGEILSFKTYEEAVEAALKYSLENYDN